MSAIDAGAPPGFRTLPHDIGLEQAILGAIMINNLAWHQVDGVISAEHFYESVHGQIFEMMGSLIRRGRVADAVTLRQRFDQHPSLAELEHGGRGYLAAMAENAAAIIEVRPYAETLADLAGRRALAQTAEEIANAAYDSENPDAFVEQVGRAQSSLQALSHLAPPDRWLSIADVTAGKIRALQTEQPVWSTGLATLDQSLAGGMRPGQLHGIEARMKSFKTGTLGTIGLSLIRQDVPFLMVLLEMGSQRVFERLIAHETGCNAVRFRQRQNTEDLVGRCQTFLDRYSGRRGYFADEPGVTFDRLRALCMEAVRKLGVQVIFVDYWQRVRGQAPRQSREEHLASVSSWFADFCAQENVAGWIASQLNREGDSFGSDSLRRDCDWLGLLHKVDCHDRMIGDFEGMWIEIAANREGPDHDLGSADAPAFRIDKLGPVLREYHDWAKAS